MSAPLDFALERRISEEGMTALYRLGCEPDDVTFDAAARIWVMGTDGSVSRTWQWPRNVDWHDAIAYRAEDRFGNTLTPDDLSDDEGDWDF